MKYISIDIETTGLDPLKNDILEIGAYIEDTACSTERDLLPCFHVYLWKENYVGNAHALAMNKGILDQILELKKYDSPLLVHAWQVADKFSKFLFEHRNLWASDNRSFTVAGKNVAGFDIPFLNQLPGWTNEIRLRHRVIDPAVLYFEPFRDECPPDLTTCKERANLPVLVTHEALDDAWDVIQLIRYKYKFPLV
jgi:oligoribonuclease